MSAPPDAPLDLPPGFLLGAATAGHAVEGGGPPSDWSLWEQVPGRVAGGATSRRGAGWWERADDDFVMAARLGLTALRFSVEWSRVEPDEGRFDEGALARYAAWAERLRGLGLEPVVCLLHGTLPAWLAARGGLARPDAVALFTRYADRVAAALSDRVRWWLTMSDPVGLVRRGLVEGSAPPGRQDLAQALLAARALARAHAATYHLLHRRVAGAQVSAGLRLRPGPAGGAGSLLDRGTAWLRHWLTNRVWLESTLEGRLRPPLGALEPLLDGSPTHDFLGVEAEDQELGPALEALAHHGLPLLVASHALAGEAAAPLEAALAEVAQATARGPEVLGYLHWSLVDGFEWEAGYGRRTGLLTVDRESGARTVSARGEALGRLARARRGPGGPR